MLSIPYDILSQQSLDTFPPRNYFISAKLQSLVHNRAFLFFIEHIHSHSQLPGPLGEGNHNADLLVSALVHTPVQQATDMHAQFLVNDTTLPKVFSITRELAWQIVKHCPHCIMHLPSPVVGVSPRRLQPTHL